MESLSDLKAKRLYFVGATTPAGHMLESAVGARKMVDAALGLGAKLVAVDTTGMVEGPLGRKLKTYKTDLVRPDYLIGIQRKREIEPLLHPFAKVSSVRVRRVSSTSEAQRKPVQFRAAKRQLSFYKHFYEAPGHIIHLDDVCCWNTWFRTGRGVKWQYVKFMEEAIGCRVLHAEVVGSGLFIVVERPSTSEKTAGFGRESHVLEHDVSLGDTSGQPPLAAPKDVAAIEQQFKTSNITIAVNETFRNILVGLADENGVTLDVGLVQAVDFKQRFMFVLSPMRTISPVRVVQFGSIRVGRDGHEIAAVRPGDL